MAPKIRLDVNAIAPPILLAGLLAAMALTALESPLYTWDLVPYVATTLADAQTDPETLHRATYAQLRATLPAPAYEFLTSGPYAARMAEDALQFSSQLPLYQVKPGYIWLLRLLDVFGLEPVSAVMLLSLLPGLLIVLLLFVWVQPLTGAWPALGIAALFIPSARLVDISRVGVPDNLSAFVLLLAVYGMTARQWRSASFGLLLFAIAVRLNNIVFVASLLAVMGLSACRKNNWRPDRSLAPIGFALAASVSVYMAIAIRNGHQWWRLFHHTFVAPIYDLNSFDESFSAQVYLDVLASAMGQILASGATLNTVLPVFLLLGSVAALLPGARRSPLLGVMAVIPPTLLVYFLMFPLVPGWDRFFTPFYALAVVFACDAAAKEGGDRPRLI
ncbi:MAG: hypothetical protein R3F50_11450 [Gammaproteobacteria bacterium]|jgi:hypothetical protein